MDFQLISKQIKKGEEISPFLFLSPNLELLHGQLESNILNILKESSIDKQSLFHLRDTGESIKIEEIKNFLAQGNIRPRFAFQIFFIEDISRMSLQSANACLKFFEEPGQWNIIVLTSNSESGILETILSRVQVIKDYAWNKDLVRDTWFYKSMISSHVSASSDELVRYFFSGKYEKQEYINFLYALIEYIAETWNYSQLLDEIHEDIWGILKNNLQGKYIADKYIILIKN